MNKILHVLIVLFSFKIGFSQTNISGVINSYAAVSNIQIQSCVSNNFTVDDATGFNVGDTVLIIQMQGATIDISNSANFGDVTNIGNAGNYEKNFISAISGNVITLGYELLNTYDVAGNVQIVNIPHYAGDVNVNGVLTAMAWNGSKGGVLAFSCSGNVTMTSNISVAGLGFRGGANVIAPSYTCNFITNRNAYYYPLNTENGSGKGEGIAVFSSGYECGRGKNANGGGGGNDHNSGGAGGGNATAGGAGGINDEPGNFNCQGDFPGVGALGLNYGNTKIFMGGGGGAGHGNNAAYNASNGAGIVFVKANTISGSIIASGNNGVIVSNDGGNGAGAGGSVFLEVNSWSAGLTVNISGGNGGNTTNINNRCYGPGGGGGKGAFLYNQASFTGTLTANPGNAGVVTNSTNACNGSSLGATSGASGTFEVANVSIPFSNSIFSTGTAIAGGTLNTPINACAGDSVYFTFSTNPTSGQSYVWQVDSTGTWEYLSDNSTFVNTTTQNMSIRNVVSSMSTHQYRLMVYNSCDSVYSTASTLNIGASPIISIQPSNYTTCAGSNALFYVSATNASSYQWQLFDGTNWNNLSNNAAYTGVTNDSLQVNNLIAVFNGNLYRVVVSNSCISLNSNSAELIIDNQPIIATAMLDTIKVCSGTDTVLVANYTGHVDSVQWQVDEGSGFINLTNNANYQNVHSDTLSFQNITHAFDEYIYRALLYNNCGNSAVSEEIVVAVFDAPSVSVNPLTNACEGQGVFVSISNLSGSNITYQWQVDTTGVWQNLGDSLGYSNTTANFIGFSSSITHPSINTDNYRVQITTDCGTAFSNIFRLNVSPAPQISIQPINDTVCVGDNAQFFIQGTDIDSFQWQNNQSGSYTNIIDGVKFSGVHNDTLTVNNIQTNDLGVLYRVRIYGVNHTCTHVTSATSQIFLSGTIQLTQQATDKTVCAGNSTSFAINAINANSYQWQVDAGGGFVDVVNNVNYSGANTDSLFLDNIPQTFDSYIFRCIVSNNCGLLNTNQYTLTVNNTQTYNQNVVLCYNDSLTLNNGTIVYNTGTYNDTIFNGSCDSIVQYNVTVLSLVSDTSFEQICINDSFQMNSGIFIYSQGIFVDTFLNATAQNCDSFHFVNLSIMPLNYDTVLQNICNRDTFISPNGNAIWNNGFVTDTFYTAQCDSFVSYNVSLLPIPNDTSTINICNNDSLLLQNGIYVNAPGMYIDTFTNATTQGCDSLHYINLTVSNPHFDTLYQIICTGDTFISPNGQELTTNGSITDTINGMVCDSFVTYNISLLPLNFDTFYATICSNENYTLPSGTLVNTSGQYNDTLSFVTSCDSIITTNLTVLQTSSSNFADTICTFNGSYTLPSGTVVTGEGIYFDTIPNVVFCDSMITITLNYVPKINATTIFQTFCNGESYVLPSGRVVSSSGIYNDTITTSLACDSILTFNITEEEPLLITNQSENIEVCEGENATLFVVATGANIQYQWQENGVDLVGQTTSSLTINSIDTSIIGNLYSVLVYNNCDTLNSQNIIIGIYNKAVVLSQSSNIEQCGGFSFMVFVEANNVVVYQWQIDEGSGYVNLNDGSLNGTSTQIIGANNDTLIVSNYNYDISGSIFNVEMTTQCGENISFSPVNAIINQAVELENTQNDTTICNHEINPINVPYVSGSAVWSNGDFGQTFTPKETGVYTVEFTDENNCPNSDEIYIEIKDCLAECAVFMPTGFSPDNSGVNDVLKALYNCDIEFFEFSIYNRYGEKVFFTDDFTIGWDGTYRGKNAEIGLYTWYLEYKFTDKSNTQSLSGNVTLIR